MSRIRQIKPAFFKDPDMAALLPAVRLFYIGLWTLADDSGYYRWDVSEVGIELFGFDPRVKRERVASTYLDQLVTAARVTRFDDCPHLFLPTFTKHQRFAGPTKRVTTYEREHLTCPQIPADPRGSPHALANARPGIGIGTGSGTERSGTADGTGPLAPSGAAPADGESESSFRRRTGLPVFMVPEVPA